MLSRTVLARVVKLLAAALCVFAFGVASAAYPGRPIRIIVPTTAGGGADTLARVLAKILTERLGQSVVVENRTGANGIIGVEAVAKSPADGHTVLLTFADHFVNPSLYPNLPFDMLADFAPVSYLGALPFVLAVHPSLPVKTPADLVVLAKSRPGQLNFASVGTGGMVHMSAELFKMHAGVEMNHIPYKGSAAALPDLVTNRVQLMFTSAISAKPFADSNQLRLIGITSKERSPTSPELPTVAESANLPAYSSLIWYGVLAPAKTPRDIVAKLNTEINAILSDAEFRATMTRQGISVAAPGTPAEFESFYRAETAKGKLPNATRKNLESMRYSTWPLGFSFRANCVLLHRLLPFAHLLVNP